MGSHTLSSFMLKFTPELIVHKGNVFYLLYVVGGLLMTVTAGSQCVDEAVRTAQSPANLRRLSNTLSRLVGIRNHTRDMKSKAKQKLKRLYITQSFKALLEITTLKETSYLNVSLQLPLSFLESTSTNCITARRCRIYYILICGASSRPALMLCMGNDRGAGIKTFNPSNGLKWLVKFSSETRARGDVIILLGGQIGRISTGFDPIHAQNNKRHATNLSIGSSALLLFFLWMLLPHFVLCIVLYLGWKAQEDIHRALQPLQIAKPRF